MQRVHLVLASSALIELRLLLAQPSYRVCCARVYRPGNVNCAKRRKKRAEAWPAIAAGLLSRLWQPLARPGLRVSSCSVFSLARPISADARTDDGASRHSAVRLAGDLLLVFARRCRLLCLLRGAIAVRRARRCAQDAPRRVLREPKQIALRLYPKCPTE